MKFQVIYRQASGTAQSPVRIIEQPTGQEIGWVNRFLDREYVRRLADTSLRLYAHNLLHFVRWWAGLHHTGEVRECDLTRINVAGLSPIPVCSTASAFGIHH